MNVNRRDFLLLRRKNHNVAANIRTFDLSCKLLFMRWVDAEATGLQGKEPAGPPSLWGGEPPARFAEATRQQLLQQLERELRDVDVLRVTDSEWLVGDLRQEVETLMNAFRARGGRIETPDS
jgi:hypothetical protein